MRDVWLCTRKADVLLADLTSRNGNVFYELGLAHAIGKPVVLVSESIDDVPFDLRGLRVLLYERKEPDWGSRLREAITGALRETMAAPTAAIPSTFIDDRTDTEQPKLTPTHRELLQLRQDVEQLKRQVSHGGFDPEVLLKRRRLTDPTVVDFDATTSLTPAIHIEPRRRVVSLTEFGKMPDEDI